jgi:membrane protease YdiL (CAAX protease family)
MKETIADKMMIIFTFIAGIFDSLIYFKTRNSLGAAIGHTLGDFPHAIRFLLGAHWILPEIRK